MKFSERYKWETVTGFLHEGTFKPAPFPGDWPTRVCAAISHLEPGKAKLLVNPDWRYVGIPTKDLVLSLAKTSTDPMVGWVGYFEFDRKSVIRSMYSQFPARNKLPFAVRNVSEGLMPFYYGLFTDAWWYLWDTVSYPQKLVEVEAAKRMWKVYAPNGNYADGMYQQWKKYVEVNCKPPEPPKVWANELKPGGYILNYADLGQAGAGAPWFEYKNKPWGNQ